LLQWGERQKGGPGGNLNLTILLSLVVAVTAVYVLKEFLAVLMLRRARRQSQEHVARRRLPKLADSVRLSRVESPAWSDETLVRQFGDPLLLSGFQDIGAYRVDQTPGMLIRIMFQSQAQVSVHIFDHPSAGNWIEMATRYEDGSTDVATTLAPTGAKSPDWFRRIPTEQGTPTRQVYESYLTQRKQQGIEMLSAAEVVREFEKAYHNLALWRQQGGLVRVESGTAATKGKGNQQRTAAAGTIG
jgi:hypothetical protein